MALSDVKLESLGDTNEGEIKKEDKNFCTRGKQVIYASTSRPAERDRNRQVNALSTHRDLLIAIGLFPLIKFIGMVNVFLIEWKRLPNVYLFTFWLVLVFVFNFLYSIPALIARFTIRKQPISRIWLAFLLASLLFPISIIFTSMLFSILSMSFQVNTMFDVDYSPFQVFVRTRESSLPILGSLAAMCIPHPIVSVIANCVLLRCGINRAWVMILLGLLLPYILVVIHLLFS